VEDIEADLAAGATRVSIARELRVHPNTLARYLKEK